MARPPSRAVFVVQSTSPQFLTPRETPGVDDIARLCDGRIADEGTGRIAISGLSSAINPKPGTVVYVQRAGEFANLSDVAAVLCTEANLDALPDGPAKIVVGSPQAAFAKLGRYIHPDGLGPACVTAEQGWRTDITHAHVSQLATVEDGAVIEAGVVIGDHAAIGRNTVIGANTVIANHCQIGRDSRIGTGTNIQYALIGNGVLVHGGVQIGQDGFGFFPGPDGLEKMPQLGRVIIQDRVEIGANTTIDRGTLDDTVIGEGTKIDNLVQVAHNVVIGRFCVIAGHVGLSGSVTLGDGCMLGGRVGIADHLTIGSNVQIAASSGVMNDIPDGARWGGTPAMPVKDFFRQAAALRKLVAADKKPKQGK